MIPEAIINRIFLCFRREIQSFQNRIERRRASEEVGIAFKDFNYQNQKL